LQTQFDDVFTQKRAVIRDVASASPDRRDVAMGRLHELEAQAHDLRDRTKAVLVQAGVDPKSKESDYVFITFILQQMPHGIVGLLIAVILSATMSATAATLNALGTTTAVDFYRPLIRPNASDHHYVIAAKALTAAWGFVAIAVASFASLVENLIEAGNILGSVFYGSILGLFLAAFFIRRVRGSAVFFAGLIAQALVFILFATTNIGYLWYNFIGCAAVLILAPLLQQTTFRNTEAPAGV
jgi:Na+/proline symporter